MATTTPNLGLTKPATSDIVDITVINTNMDKIDAAVGGSVDLTGSTSLADMMGRIAASGTKEGTGKVGVADEGTLTGILGATAYNYANCRVLYRGEMLFEAFAIPEWGETTIQQKFIFFENGVQQWKLSAWKTISA